MCDVEGCSEAGGHIVDINGHLYELCDSHYKKWQYSTEVAYKNGKLHACQCDKCKLWPVMDKECPRSHNSYPAD